MKPTPQDELELLQVYDTWMHSYLNGDIDTYASFLHETYHFIGSTNNEEYLNKQDTVSFLEATADQLAGKTDIRNKKRIVEQLGSLVLVTELLDAYFLNEQEWMYYGRFRFTSAMQQTDQGWMIMYQHFSTPDSKAEEGETIGYRQVSEENLMLREAIRRRTIELEQKNQELELEAALERVRSRTMAMQHSRELADLVSIVFRELNQLGFTLTSCIIWINDPNAQTNTLWVTSAEMNEPARPVQLKLFEHPFFHSIIHAWKANDPKWVYTLEGKEKESFEQAFFASEAEMPAKLKHALTIPEKVVFSASFNKFGALEILETTALTDEKFAILHRFGKAFNDSYTRFNDLQKAEAQAREAQIEAALERVRSRSLAMHKTAELQSVIHTVHQELLNLNISIAGGSFIVINSEIDRELHCWGSGGTADTSDEVHIPYFGKPFYTHIIERIKNGPGFFTEEYSQEEKIEFFTFLFQHAPWSHLGEKDKEATLTAPGGYTRSCAVSEHTSIFIINHFGEKFSEADNAILRRFGKVFEQSYTRFLDLQRAEVQAREAEIELGLEKVRSRSMAMQHSAELKALVQTLSAEIRKLDVLFTRTFIVIYDAESLASTWWMSNPETNESFGLFIGYHELTPYLEHLKAWRERRKAWQYRLEGADKKQWDHFLFSETDLSKLPEGVKADMQGKERVYLSCSFSNFGYLVLESPEPISSSQFDILYRFAKEFDQTYTRFLDIQKAEAQAREREIELSLERIRSQSMQMQHSDELDKTSRVFHEQLVLLGIPSEFSYVWLPDVPKEKHLFWAAWQTPAGETQSKSVVYDLDRSEPYTAACFAAWESNTPVYVQPIAPEEVQPFFDTWAALLEGADQLKAQHFPEGLYYAESYMKYGCLGINIRRPLTATEEDILYRFSIEFERTYTRFLDLQRAEYQTRQAKIETALEKVRARALAMQHPEELKEVAQVMRNEMGMLGVEELETSSIYIHGDSSENVECWYALQDPKSKEKKMVADHFQLNLDDTWVGREMKKFYHSNDVQATIVMQGANRKEWIEYCYKNSPAFTGFYGETIPDRTYHLYKFSSGYIGAAAPGSISHESWDLLQRAASVFSLAYSRFRDLTQARIDLQRLKEAKQKAEDAFAELQATQKQLIQAEKMASLGELTAGIAHEIQNPLNFVNNFSEVNRELISELVEEVDKGNTEEVKLIAEDIKDNSEKINHHGRRADAIVKGMLQHSRSSAGQKEPADVNALCEEYLRLAFHGLRARDKSFQADLEFCPDPGLPKLNITVADIARVLLNLVNNAFYAVNKRKLESEPGYVPKVCVRTSQNPDEVIISVEDNGTGIPAAILDKIFQPFFTTKPTGEGTGLGLSLSYDIVTKGHAGKLLVESSTKDGTIFKIVFPKSL